MSVSTVETWRVMTPEGVFEADLDTLKQWIVEGCVLPTDKVAKGNLNWIDAGRAPSLRRAFAGEVDTPASLPPQTESFVTPAAAPQSSWPEETTPEDFNQDTYTSASAPPAFSHEALAIDGQAMCYTHAETPPEFICRACSNVFCRACPNFVNRIPLCPLCGDMCKSFQEVKEKAVRRQSQNAGFGFAEFKRSLAYPFSNIFSLVFMAVVYAVLLFGGFKGQIVAWGILFGCMSHVISQFAWGRTDRGILPEFDNFSWWDNILRPMFLSIGIFIITFGPMIALVIALFFGVFRSSSPAPLSLSPDQMQPPAQSEQLTQEDMDALIDGNDPEKEAIAAEKVEKLRPATRINTELEKQKEPAIPLSSMLALLGISGAFIFLFLLSLVWAFFYYPMALAVAGYTEDFWSVINPLVGLDTMRRMGFVYVKAFLMYFCVQIIGIGLTIGAFIILSPFELPFFGNLPASFVNGIITFYTSLVVACILGFALFKCADKLDIQVD